MHSPINVTAAPSRWSGGVCRGRSSYARRPSERGMNWSEGCCSCRTRLTWPTRRWYQLALTLNPSHDPSGGTKTNYGNKNKKTVMEIAELDLAKRFWCFHDVVFRCFRVFIVSENGVL